LKDDLELNSYLLQTALDHAELHVTGDAPSLSDAALGELAREFLAVMTTAQRLSKRYPAEMIEQFIYMPTLPPQNLEDRAHMSAWIQELQERLNAGRSHADVFALSLVEVPDTLEPALLIDRRIHGLSDERVMPLDFFETAEYRRIRQIGEKLDGLIGQGAYVKRGERQRDVTSFKTALAWLMDEAKRGQTIQRYKGLGEMNPEQLWDTTMDPDTRRLLLVTIEDLVATDQLFTTLMGDQVEPRREFIERNALAVENLDV